jgi:ubiquitin-protein ligase
MASRRLAKEFQEIQTHPIPHLDISLENDSLYTWHLILLGPVRLFILFQLKFITE